MRKANSKKTIQKNSKKVKKMSKQKQAKKKEKKVVTQNNLIENEEISEFNDGSFSVGLHDYEDYSQINDYGAEVQEHDDYEYAILYFNKAIELAPEKDQAYYYKSLSLHKLNQQEKALKYIRKALEIDPDNEESQDLQSKILKKLKRQGKEINVAKKAQTEHIQSIKPKINNENEIVNYANALWEQQKYNQSIPYYDLALKFDPNNIQFHLRKGFSLQDSKYFLKAIGCYNQVLTFKIDQQTEEFVLINKGISLGSINRYEEELACYDRLIQLNPKHPEVYYHKGLCLQHLNGYRKSLELFQQALKVNPNHIQANKCRNEVLEHLEIISKTKHIVKKKNSVQQKKK